MDRTRFGDRRDPLANALATFGSPLRFDQVLLSLDALLAEHVELMRERVQHDPTYRHMIEVGRDNKLLIV